MSGCMVQRFADEMKRRLPEVDRFLGLNDVERVVEACDLADAGFIPDSNMGLSARRDLRADAGHHRRLGIPQDRRRLRPTPAPSASSRRFVEHSARVRSNRWCGKPGRWLRPACGS